MVQKSGLKLLLQVLYKKQDAPVYIYAFRIPKQRARGQSDITSPGESSKARLDFD